MKNKNIHDSDGLDFQTKEYIKEKILEQFSAHNKRIDLTDPHSLLLLIKFVNELYLLGFN